MYIFLHLTYKSCTQIDEFGDEHTPMKPPPQSVHELTHPLKDSSCCYLMSLLLIIIIML